MRRRYPSDLSETRWNLIRDLISESHQKGRKRATDLREVVNAMNYRWTTGCPWRMLPHDFPAWETVYTYYDRWRKDGRLRLIREILLRKSPYQPLNQLRQNQLEKFCQSENGGRKHSTSSRSLQKSA